MRKDKWGKKGVRKVKRCEFNRYLNREWSGAEYESISVFSKSEKQYIDEGVEINRENLHSTARKVTHSSARSDLHPLVAIFL